MIVTIVVGNAIGTCDFVEVAGAAETHEGGIVGGMSFLGTTQFSVSVNYFLH